MTLWNSLTGAAHAFSDPWNTGGSAVRDAARALDHARGEGGQSVFPIPGQVRGAMGVMHGAAQMYQGGTSFARHPSLDAALQVGRGGLTAAGGVATALGRSPVSQAMSAAGGLVEAGQGVHTLATDRFRGAASERAVNQILHGGLATGSAVADAMGNERLRALMSAGAAGVSIGQTANTVAGMTGALGTDDRSAGRGLGGAPAHGPNVDIVEHAAITGQAVDRAVGGGVLGGALGGGAAVADAELGVVRALSPVSYLPGAVRWLRGHLP